MTRRHTFPALTLTVALLALTGCASTPVDVSATANETTSNSVRLRTTAYSASGTPKEVLQISATLQNGTTAELRRLGCVRPELAIDSATATGGWVPLAGAQQMESTALCFSPYYIVAAGSSAAFETGFVRTNPDAKFPRGVALRLRLVGPTPESGPTAPIILAP